MALSVEVLTTSALFGMGLVAAVSSCGAVVGGLLLSMTAKEKETTTVAQRRVTIGLFVMGRLLGYAVFGGILGLVGKVLQPSSFVMGVLILLVAFYLVVAGLEMLNLAPVWLRRLQPRMPLWLSRRVMDAQGHPHPLAPALLGAGTFFLPCGFTQALQFYAISTGSLVVGAWSLFVFALGTAPVLFGIGMASSHLKGDMRRRFTKFSGVLLVIFGLWSFKNGLTLVGFPLPTVQASAPLTTVMEGQDQVIRMTVGAGGYQPNSFTIRAGKPTRWEIEGLGGGGCASAFQSEKLGIQQMISKGANEISLPALEPGVYPFHCSMGMYRGVLNVVN